MAVIAQGISSLISSLRNTFKGLIPLFILALYTIIGAWLFCEIEGPNEQHLLKQQQQERNDLIKRTVYKINYLQIKKQRNLMSAEEEFNKTAKVLNTFQETLGVVSPDPEKDVHWTFLGALFYCMTVYTTIGYGNIVPVTVAGRILTIIYAFIGIPLTVISLFCLGSLFARGCKFLWKLFLRSTRVVSKDLERKITEAAGNVEDGINMSQSNSNSSEENEDDLLSFPISGLIFITVIWVLFCAVLFQFLENWDFGTSMYFTLISFTTIGFGDVLPSDYDYMIVVGICLLIGLSLVSTVMNIIQQQIEALASGVKNNIDEEYARALTEAKEDGDLDEEDEQKSGNDGGKAFDAVLSRMDWKKRALYYAMPSNQKKQLQKISEKKMGRKTIKTQTDSELLDTLIREEILKAELNNEIHKFAPRSRSLSQQPKLVYSDVREKEIPIEVIRVGRVNMPKDDFSQGQQQQQQADDKRSMDDNDVIEHDI